MDKSSEQIRSIGLTGAVAIGVGGMVGGGIFAVLGEAISFAGGATPIAFLFAGLIAVLTAYSYAKLSVHFQNRGGTVYFVDKAFNHNLLSGSLNLFLWLSYLVTIALYAKAFASYGLTFFSHQSSEMEHFLISLAIILPMVINLVSSQFVSRSETLIVGIKLILLLVIMSFGAETIDMPRIEPQHWEGMFSIIIAGMVIFVAYEGFELIANAAEEIKQPQKNLPRAFYLSVVGVLLLYVGIAIVAVGSVPEEKLLQAKDYALAIAAEPALGSLGFQVVAIAALLATFSAINATIYGNARLGYLLAQEGELPRALDHEKRHIPVNGILIIAAISLLLANTINLTAIAILGSAGFLLIFAVVNLSAFRLRKEIGASAFISLLAFIVSSSALGVLLYQTAQHDWLAIGVFIGFIVVSWLFECCYGRWIRKHWLNRQYSGEDE